LFSFLAEAAFLFAQNYKIVNANSGKVLEVQNGATGLGGVVDQWDWNGGAHQQWQIVPLGNGYNEIFSVNSGKVLDDEGGGTGLGNRLWQWDWWGGANQQWQIVPQGSSYNSIVNLNSGMVLDVQGASTDDGAIVQQWDWFTGLNQQWEIVPVQDDYQTTGQTNMWYDPGSNTVYSTASIDSDYSTSYYYNGQIVLSEYDNGSYLQGTNWGFEPGQYGFGTAFDAFYGSPGHYYEADSNDYLSAQYYGYQVIPDCTAYCYDFYDPFDYDILEKSPGSTDSPTWNTTVWGPTLVIAIMRVGQTINLGGQNGSSVTVPGNPSLFDVKFRSFIPPAWIWGAGPPLDFCINSYGVVYGVIYAGDNRDFSPYSERYKTHSEAVIDANSGTALTRTDAGTPVRYSGDALAPDGYTLIGDDILHDCHLTDDRLKETNLGMHVDTNGGGGEALVHFYGSALNATTWPVTADPIDWDATLTINTGSNPASPAWTFSYTHDCFPAFEAYIGSQRIYDWKPTSYQWVNIGACLHGYNQRVGSKNGNVQ
jgi:hypothetical protein